MRASRGVSFRVLLGGLFFGLISTSLVLVYVMHVRFVERYELEQIRAHAESQTESIALLLQSDLMSGFYPAIVQRANRTIQVQPEIVGLQVRMRDGYTVYDSVKSGLNPKEVFVLTKRILPSALSGQSAADGDWIGSVTTWFSLQAHLNLMRKQRRTIVVFGLGLLVLALSSSVAVAAALSRPIQRLALEMKRGDLVALRDLVPEGGAERINELHDLYAQTHLLARQNLEYQSELVRRAKELALAEFARQVAHDIRSPLAALETAAADLSQVPEDKRLLIRSAANRIHDIANSLLESYRERAGGAAPVVGATPHSCLLSGLIEPVLTEKRLQMRTMTGINIEASWDSASYGIFALVQAVEFGRVLSNLVNNAVEALAEGKGSVRISLAADGDFAVVRIKDDGKGIPPEVLGGLGRRGVSHEKASGSGLGLHHARECAASWGGRLEIDSQLGTGTTVSLYMPLASPPKWFVPELRLVPGRPLVILDDDSSVHQVWTERLKPHAPTPVVHLHGSEDLLAWVGANARAAAEALYLLDYELIGQEKTGLSLAETLGLGARAVLVTSWYDDAAIVERCISAGIRMIPKGLARLVPISVVEAERLDAVLIDDDALARMTWKMAAAQTGKRFRSFATMAEFLAASSEIHPQTPLYIDADLGGGVRGDEEAKRLHENGFTEIYLATGHDPERFAGQNHLKGVRGKQPPWLEAA